jgi:ABC-type Fe3+/spermidine/putrescine transport system ATPase subunit
VPKSEAQGRVRDALSTVGLAGLEDRPATRLSGGQQQRVALARALVHRPAVLLLDEPLSNLDVQLREQMRFELKRLQRRLGWTLVNVTHDQVEALGLSDRIAIMNRGRIEQVGTPRELYEWPATPFVRDFLGKSVNLGARIRGIAGGRAGVALACNPDSVVECALPAGSSFAAGDQVRISVRPEAISVGRAGGSVSGSGPVLEGTVSTVLYQGERSACEVKVGDEAILVYLSAGCTPQPGEPIAFAIDPGALRLWPAP